MNAGRPSVEVLSGGSVRRRVTARPGARPEGDFYHRRLVCRRPGECFYVRVPGLEGLEGWRTRHATCKPGGHPFPTPSLPTLPFFSIVGGVGLGGKERMLSARIRSLHTMLLRLVKIRSWPQDIIFPLILRKASCGAVRPGTGAPHGAYKISLKSWPAVTETATSIHPSRYPGLSFLSPGRPQSCGCGRVSREGVDERCGQGP